MDEPSVRRKGLWLAAATAAISGMAVFFNGYGVRAWSEVSDPTTYTTVKNLLAGLAIVVFGLAVARSRRKTGTPLPLRPAKRASLVAIAVIGGSLPFALFFEGLARASSSQAAFIHKTLVIWVAFLALLFLRERIGWPHLVAIGLLVWGQWTLSGGGAITPGSGEIMILVATLLWSVEVIVAKRLLRDISYASLANVRMIGGAGILVFWSLLRGVEINWAALSASHVGWVVLAALFLSGYVLTWFSALAKAPAVDVTAVLVGGALITAVLESTVRGAPMPDLMGTTLVAMGIVVAVVVSATKLGPDRP